VGGHKLRRYKAIAIQKNKVVARAGGYSLVGNGGFSKAFVGVPYVVQGKLGVIGFELLHKRPCLVSGAVVG
jgi:hypothetical protein